MRLGVHLPQFRAPAGGPALTAAARAAEEAGADDVWVSDHLILPAGSRRPPEAFHDALVTLAWAAAATSRVGLGTSVLVAPYRHPVAAAKALASLDALSGGRVIAGVASGWLEAEFAALDAPFAGRGPATDRAIRTWRALWAGEDAGPALAGMRLSPPPARPGGPPVWVGGDSDAGIRRAVRLGDAWHTTVSDPDALATRLAVLRSELARAGRDPAGLPVSVRVRASAADVAALAPRLAALGVGHLLVDPPAATWGDLGGEYRRLRGAVPAG